jgi:hypothetical protein
MVRRAYLVILPLAAQCWAAETDSLPVRVTWGHTSSVTAAMQVQVRSDGGAVMKGQVNTGPTEGARDGLQFLLECPPRTEPKLQRLQMIWADLLAAADADSARRIGQDASMDPQSPRLYVQTRAGGTGGFAVTVEQSKRERAIWVPSLDIYITAGAPLVEFEEHLTALGSFRGKRIPDQTQSSPEASYEEYVARWEDMGSPAYRNPQQVEPGHITGLAWDSSIHKFGIDRAAAVRNDYGNPDRFHLWYEFGDITKSIGGTWKGQSLHEGLPVITTVFEREGLRYELE